MRPCEVRDWNKEQKADAMKQLLQQTQAQGVKIEGGADVAQDIAHVVSQGTAVMGHVGLMPQYASDHRVGRAWSMASGARIVKDARTIAKAGVFALVVECVPQTLAAEIASAVDVPVIGIGRHLSAMDRFLCGRYSGFDAAPASFCPCV